MVSAGPWFRRPAHIGWLSIVVLLVGFPHCTFCLPLRGHVFSVSPSLCVFQIPLSSPLFPMCPHKNSFLLVFHNTKMVFIFAFRVLLCFHFCILYSFFF